MSIGLDACEDEICSDNLDYCYNKVKPLQSYSVLTNNNGRVPPQKKVKAFVSLDLDVHATCSKTPIPKVRFGGSVLLIRGSGVSLFVSVRRRLITCLVSPGIHVIPLSSIYLLSIP